MPSAWFDFHGGIGWVTGSGVKACVRCGQWADRLCDWPMGKGKTCDALLCVNCAGSVGPEVDFCPVHAMLYREQCSWDFDKKPGVDEMAVKSFDRALVAVASSSEPERERCRHALWSQFVVSASVDRFGSRTTEWFAVRLEDGTEIRGTIEKGKLVVSAVLLPAKEGLREPVSLDGDAAILAASVAREAIRGVVQSSGENGN